MSILGYTCPIPGADPALVAWHTTVHLGLTLFIVVAGTIFLALAVVAFVRTSPSRARAPEIGWAMPQPER